MVTNNKPVKNSHKILGLSLRWRFVLLSIAISLFVFSGLTMVLIRNSTESLRNNLTERSKAFAQLATDPIGDTFLVYKDSGKVQIDKQVRDLLQLSDDITGVKIVDLQGNSLYELTKGGNFPSTSSLDPKKFETSYEFSRGLITKMSVPFFESNLSHRYTIIYSVTSSTIDTAIRKEATALLLFSLIGLFATSILTYLFVNNFILRPIATVSEQATKISDGNLEVQISTTRHDEIGNLARSLNAMAKGLKDDIIKLQELDKTKSEFMMIASHNLRTPLSVINGYIENIELFKTKEQFADAIHYIGDSARRLGAFAEDILAISRIEMGEKLEVVNSVELPKFIANLTKEFKTSSELKHIKFEEKLIDIPEEMLFNTLQVRSALYNLFDNAVKFTGAGGVISFVASATNDVLTLQISDTGIGVSPEELPHLFTKFHRGTSTINYDYEGAGIGLYASKVLIEANGGTISAQSELGKGSCFTITIPIKHKGEETDKTIA